MNRAVDLAILGGAAVWVRGRVITHDRPAEASWCKSPQMAIT
jgi:hypothetical protein